MEDKQSKDLILLQILILGGGSADGKTCILQRYSENRFCDVTLATIGMDYKKKTIHFDNHEIKLTIWDTAGQERFRPLNRKYYKRPDGVIFVCDITNYDSFNEMIICVEEVNDIEYNKPKIICANKCDLEERTQLAKEKIIEYGLSHNIEVFETSAKTGQNINKAFHRLVELILRKKEKDSEILKNMNSEKFLYDFRLDLISNDCYSLFKMLNFFCDDIVNLLGRKIFEFNNYKMRLITYINNKNKKKQEQFLNKIKSKKDGIIFFIDINSNSSFEKMKELISENIQNNSERLAIIRINNSENLIKELSNEIEIYLLNQEIKVFIIKEIYRKIANEIFVELISLILKKKENNQIYEEFNNYIIENIYKFKYAIIGDKFSGKSEIFEEYFILNESKVGIQLLNLNKYKIKLEIYDIDESNIIDLLNKYKINGIIFVFSPNSLESFGKIKEFINVIKQNYINDYENIICANKRNLNINDEIISKEINDYFLEQKKDIYELNIENTINKVDIYLTYQILLKKKNEKLISEFFRYYRQYFPIHEYEKKLNKYLNY